MTHKYAHITSTSETFLWKLIDDMEFSSGYDLDNGMTKDAYLEWVRKWKEDYKALSQLIRSIKNERKIDFIEMNWFTLKRKHGTENRVWVVMYHQAAINSCLVDLKKIATDMLTKRAEYKIIAGIKREESLCPA